MPIVSVFSPTRTSLAALTLALLASTTTCFGQTKAQTGEQDLGTIDVTSEAARARGPVGGPVAKRSSTGTKTDTPIVETPASVSVVSREQMEAQGARTVQEALRYEPGVVSDARPGSRYDTIIMRGFGGFGGNANYVQYWDGLRLFKGVNYAVPSVDTYLLERIDISRGPGSALYGQGNPGGSVDLVSKWADDHAVDELTAGLDSKGGALVGVDVGGKADDEGKALWRFVGLGRGTHGDPDGTDGRRWSVAPMFTWKPNADTTIRFQASWEHDQDVFYSLWLPAIGTLQTNPNGRISRSFYPGNPNFDAYERSQGSLAWQVEHRFDETWSARQNFRFLSVDNSQTMTSTVGWAVAASCGGVAYRCLSLSSSRYVEHLRGGAVDNQVEARFAFGGVQQRLLFGIDAQVSAAESRNGSGATTTLDYLSPTRSVIAVPGLTTRQTQNRTQLGFYAQDQIEFGNWRLLLGGREDVANADVATTTLATGARTAYRAEDSAFTWRSGLLYHFDNGLAPFLAYSTSFDPTLGTGYGGTPFVPTTAEQYEAGLKWQPVGFDGLFTLSVFDLTQRNVLTTDTLHTSTNTALTLCSSSTCQTQTGEVRSRGVEVGGKATVMTGLTVMASYAFTEAKVAASAVTGVQGKAPVGVPRHTASAWADYTWSSGTLAGFGIGGGVRYVGETYGDQTNTEAMRVPGRTLLDAAIHYDLPKQPGSKEGWRLAAGVTNIADLYYVSACASANQCFLGTGRTFTADLKYRW